MPSEPTVETGPSEPQHSRREVMRIGAAAAAVAAGAAIIGTSRPAFAAVVASAKPPLTRDFRVSVAGLAVPFAKRVTFLRQAYAAYETPVGNGYVYEAQAIGDLDVLIVVQRQTVPHLDAWFAAVRDGSDSNDPRELVVEALNPTQRIVLRTWRILARPKRYERGFAGTDEKKSTEWRYLLRGSLSASQG